MRKTRTQQLIEFKGMTVPVVAVTLRTLDIDDLTHTASDLFGDSDFFDGDAALLELAQTGPAEDADWPALRALFAQHGLRLVGVRGGSEALRAAAAAAGLPAFAAHERPARGGTPVEAPPVTPEPAPAPPPVEAPPAAAPAPLEAAAPAPVLVVDRPLRSGQQVYARGGDLVVLAAVNPGAEVIADGSIHIYAPLRGRALAGARGQPDARIFTTHFAAELVSVGGVYRTFEGGVPAALAGQPAQVRLEEREGGSTLRIDAMRID